jgi:hypothetical protein
LDARAAALSEARGQLERLVQRLEQSNADLTQELALYLQVLRDVLPMAVHQAAFHVATQLVPERYGALEEGKRQDLQRRLQELVKRCGDLLTLEQLMVLAKQVRSEQKRLNRREHQRLMAALSDASDEEGPDGRDSDEPLPPGSVRLGLDLPLSADLFASGLPGLVDLGALVGTVDEVLGEENESFAREADADTAGDRDDHRDVDIDGDGDLEADAHGEDEAEPEADDDHDTETGSEGSDRFASLHSRGGLQHLLAMAGAQFGRDAAKAEPDEEERFGPLEEGADPFPVPQQPAALLRWWEALDQALQRRLRNLSHAINLELLRLGLTRSLLPINLLDAVLEGQIEAMPAPANLLRLSMPFAPEGMAAPLEAVGLLLRSSDLEFDQARLRTLRRRLERRRQDVRKMAQQHRHWQRRAQALEAEQQWLQDSRTNLPAPP